MIDDKAVFLLPLSVLSTNIDAEKNICKTLIESNLIDAVILMPDKMFESTSIATCIIVFDKHKNTRTIEMIDMRQTYEEEKRPQNGQFGGASHEKRTYYKTFKVITDEGMQKALDAINNRSNEPGFCKSVSIEDIRKHDYMLQPRGYIEFEEHESIHRPYEDIAADYNHIMRMKNAVKLTVNEKLAKLLGVYDMYQLLKTSPDLNKSFSVVGCKAEKEQYLVMSKNAAEFKIENKSTERIPEIIMLFVQMWKQHIMYLNNEENIILAEFRDALLPDLMSGKIDVSKIEV